MIEVNELNMYLLEDLPNGTNPRTVQVVLKADYLPLSSYPYSCFFSFFNFTV